MMLALQNSRPVQQYLASELAEGRIAGPFNEQEVPQVHVNRQTRVMVLDPGPVIPAQLKCKQRYRPAIVLGALSVDQAVAHILQVGQGARLAKVDMAHAFRNFPNNPEDRHLLGMRWGNDILLT